MKALGIGGLSLLSIIAFYRLYVDKRVDLQLRPPPDPKASACRDAQQQPAMKLREVGERVSAEIARSSISETKRRAAILQDLDLELRMTAEQPDLNVLCAETRRVLKDKRAGAAWVRREQNLAGVWNELERKPRLKFESSGYRLFASYDFAVSRTRWSRAIGLHAWRGQTSYEREGYRPSG